MDTLKDLDVQSSYKIVRKLASGGMGDVFLGHQYGVHGFQKTVALKVIREDMLKLPNNREMFISEAKLVADLVHENIAHVYNLCASGNTLFIVMEYIKGITLSRFIREHRDRGQHVDPEMAAFLASRVARALAYAHRKTDNAGKPLGIVHRDVTPGNIMIDSLGVVKLTDFGIAKVVTDQSMDEQKVLMGKYPYMSPEQVNLQGTSHRSDIYALGITLYEILAQKKPFPAKSRPELLEMMRKPIEAPDALNPWIKPDLSDITMKMIRQKANERYSSARKIVIALERYMYDGGYGPTNEKLALYIKRLLTYPSNPAPE